MQPIKHSSLVEHFLILSDPRQEDHNMKKHKLIDIVVIAVLGTIAAADGWEEIADFGEQEENWLGQFLELPYGIPSHDTFGRVFSILDPEEFQQCFFAWVASVNEMTNGQVVAVDGKTNRRSHDKAERPLHIVTAFATANGVALGQLATDKKSNEITAVPALLKLLELKGCIITADAMSCQQKIVKTILEQGADYLLAVKGNQKMLLEDIKILFKYGHDRNWKDIQSDYCETSDKDHGRVEVRKCFTISDPEQLKTIGTSKTDWLGLNSIAEVTCQRTERGKTTASTRYYISSLSGNARQSLKASRDHWQIENNLHWSLDVSFREDESRIRIGHAQENLNLVRKLALARLKQNTTGRGGIKRKRLRAARDHAFLAEVAGIMT
jgi:predicted transposase YbfD/YdcC